MMHVGCTGSQKKEGIGIRALLPLAGFLAVLADFRRFRFLVLTVYILFLGELVLRSYIARNVTRGGLHAGSSGVHAYSAIWRRLVCFSHCAEYFITMRAALFYRFDEYEIDSENCVDLTKYEIDSA